MVYSILEFSIYKSIQSLNALGHYRKRNEMGEAYAYGGSIVIIIIGVIVAIGSIAAIGCALYFYIFRHLLSKKTTVQATVFLKKQNSDTMDYINPIALDTDLGTESIFSPLWEKFLDLIKYDLWRPERLDEHYCIIFDINGHKLELYIPESSYIELTEGQHIVLTYKGDRYIHHVNLSKRNQNTSPVSTG